jgi:hypothetical protein
MYQLRMAVAIVATLSATPAGAWGLPEDGSVLPFQTKPSASVGTLQESKLVRFPPENHLPKDAPNILMGRPPNGSRG